MGLDKRKKLATSLKEVFKKIKNKRLMKMNGLGRVLETRTSPSVVALLLHF